MNLVEEFQNLDYSNPGGLPSWFKLASVIVLMILIGVGGYFFQIKDQTKNLFNFSSLS